MNQEKDLKKKIYVPLIQRAIILSASVSAKVGVPGERQKNKTNLGYYFL